MELWTGSILKRTNQFKEISLKFWSTINFNYKLFSDHGYFKTNGDASQICFSADTA